MSYTYAISYIQVAATISWMEHPSRLGVDNAVACGRQTNQCS